MDRTHYPYSLALTQTPFRTLIFPLPVSLALCVISLLVYVIWHPFKSCCSFLCIQIKWDFRHTYVLVLSSSLLWLCNNAYEEDLPKYWEI